MVPVDGEPAIVGRFCRVLRKEASEALLAGEEGVPEDAVVEARVAREVEAETTCGTSFFKLATRWMVVGASAFICIGGRATDCAFCSFA